MAEKRNKLHLPVSCTSEDPGAEDLESKGFYGGGKVALGYLCPGRLSELENG